MCFCVFQVWALSKEQRTRCSQLNSDLQRKRSQMEKRQRSSLKKKWGHLDSTLTVWPSLMLARWILCLSAVIHTTIIERSRGQELRVVKQQNWNECSVLMRNIVFSREWWKWKMDSLMDILHCLKQGATPMVKRRLLYFIISCMRSQIFWPFIEHLIFWTIFACPLSQICLFY